MHTFFATAKRTGPQELEAEIQLIHENPIVNALLNAVSGSLVVLDENRQIVAINDSFLKLQGITDPTGALGLRLGEAFKCPHAGECPGGCGTSEFCSTCGAALAIVTSQSENKPVERTCSISATIGGKQVDIFLQIKSSPIDIGNRQFLLLFIQDITEQQRRAALEHTFFTDINSILIGLSGAAEMLANEINDKTGLVKAIHQASMRLRKEVEIQKCLSRDGEGSYRSLLESTTTGHIQKLLDLFYSSHPAAEGRCLDLHIDLVDRTFKTDVALLIRILSNMITNALEATDAEHPVNVWVEEQPQHLTFCVHNEQEIHEEIARRIFERNFSTQTGGGRGTGTFSMKLFGEKILGGIVFFETSAEKGTVFKLVLPV